MHSGRLYDCTQPQLGGFPGIKTVPSSSLRIYDLAVQETCWLKGEEHRHGVGENSLLSAVGMGELILGVQRHISKKTCRSTGTVGGGRGGFWSRGARREILGIQSAIAADMCSDLWA